MTKLVTQLDRRLQSRIGRWLCAGTLCAMASGIADPWPASGQETYPSTQPAVVQSSEEPFQQVLDRLFTAERRLAELEGARLPPVVADGYTPVAVNQATPLEQRVLALESELKKQEEAAAKKKASDATKPTQKWTGRIHADYWAFPDTSPGADAFETGSSTNSVDDRFLFRRVRIGLQGDIPDNMQYKLERGFQQPSGGAVQGHVHRLE